MRALLKAVLSRPIFCLVLGLCTGIAQVKILSPATEALFAVAIFLLLIASAFALQFGRDLFLSIALFALGICAGLLRAQPLARSLAEAPKPYAAAVKVSATVLQDLGTREDSGRQALILGNLQAEDLQAGKNLDWPGKLRLSYQPDNAIPAPGPGDRIGFLGSLRGLQEPSNPGEFDYRSFMLGRGVASLASSRGSAPPQILQAGSPWDLRRLAWLARRALLGNLERILSPRAAALARGIVFGDTSALSNEDMSLYARTGIVYILCVAGMHLALAVALFIWIGRSLGLKRKALAMVALGLACAYAMICGLPVSCQRSLCLFSMVALGQALDLDTDLATSLSLGGVLILMIQPGSLFEAGTQLSFMVSFSLVEFTPRLEKIFPDRLYPKLRTLLAGVLAAEAASVPLVAWHFGMYCWTAPLAVLATSPLLGLIIALGLLVALLGGIWPYVALLAAWPLERLLAALDFISAHLASLPHAAFSVGRPSLLWILAALGLALCFAVIPKRRILFGALPLLLWLLWPGLPWAHRHPGLTKTWFFSVGQGDSSLTEFPDGKILLVDAGPRNPDAGSWVIGPALRRLGMNRVDWAVVTHPHADHLGGMFWVLKQFPVGLLLHSGTLERPPLWLGLLKVSREEGVPLCNLNTESPPLDWAGRIQKLVPHPPRLVHTKNDMHNNNVVLKVGDWLLLMGDMQKEGEARLLREHAPLKCDVLKIGHHGSQTSSTLKFLKAADPQACVIQCGAHNRYRHPSPLTLKHLAGRALYRNDLQGCIFAEHDASGSRLWTWRQVPDAELWQAPPKMKRSIWKTLEKEGLIEKEEE